MLQRHLTGSMENTSQSERRGTSERESLPRNWISIRRYRWQIRSVLCAPASQFKVADTNRVQNFKPIMEQNIHFVSS